MSRKYKIRDQEKLYFVTFTVIHWIDIFIRNEYKEVLLESIRYCHKNKGLEVYAWVIMTSYVHMIVGTKGANKLEGIIRDMKSHTSMQMRKLLENKEGFSESRREWILWIMQRAGKKNSNNIDFQFWQQHFHPIELSTNELLEQKLDYIHNNPVEAGFVENAEDWIYSSAKDYCGLGKGMLDVLFIE